MQRVHEAATINPGPARPGPVEEAREQLQHSSPCYATQSLHHWTHRQLCPTLTKDSLIGQKEKRSSLTNDAGEQNHRATYATAHAAAATRWREEPNH